MMRSLYSGVTGLKSHQTKMDVIGNNIANVNTVGFKSGRVMFQEVLNQTLKTASAPDAANSRGGTNPMQVGLGLSVGAIDTITTRGSFQRTENPTDVAIDGEGYFIVRVGENDENKFTRAGNFGLDKEGNLVTANGLRVQGWQTFDKKTQVVDTGKPIESLNFYQDDINGNKKIKAADKTTEAIIAGNLDSTSIAKGVAIVGPINTVGVGTIQTIPANNNMPVTDIAPANPRNGDKYLNKGDSLVYTYDALTDVWTPAGLPVPGDYMDTTNGKVYNLTIANVLNELTTIAPDFVMPMTAYDSLGNEYNMKIAMYKCFTAGAPPQTSWYWQALNPSGATLSTNSGYIRFDDKGASVPIYFLLRLIIQIHQL